MGKQKQIMLGMLFAFALVFSMALISGAITINTPATAGTTVTGTYLFNVTTAISEAQMCNLSTTANAQFNSTLNASASQTEFTFSHLTTGLTDAEDTTLTVNCSNATASEVGTLLINVDNTAPVCSLDTLAIGEETIDFMDAYGVFPTTSGVSDTTDMTWAWTLYDPNGNAQDTSTSTSNINFEGDDFDEIGDFIIALVITDEASLSTECSSNRTVTVVGSNGDDVIVGGGAVTTFFSSNRVTLIVLGILFLIAVIGIASIFAVMKMKKRN